MLNLLAKLILIIVDNNVKNNLKVCHNPKHAAEFTALFNNNINNTKILILASLLHLFYKVYFTITTLNNLTSCRVNKAIYE